jgi:hypothetical protein
MILTGMLILAMMTGGLRLNAQQKDITLKFFPSSWYHGYYEPGFDGYGLGVAYHPIMSKFVRLNLLGEFDILRSRNEVLLGFGINKTFWQAERFRISIESNLLSGVDLYKPAPLYVGGLEGGVRFDYYVRKKLTLFISAGARATVCPGYRDYGVMWHSSWPLTAGLRF